MKQAWYLGVNESQVGQRAILVGDPGRIDRLAAYLDNVQKMPENRMLRTISGDYNGVRITASAFGMGAPIAAIVMHELAFLGVHSFVRVGTAMVLPPITLGEHLVALDALPREGTSTAYGNPGQVIAADALLAGHLQDAALARGDRPVHAGRYCSFDGFYRDMFALDASADVARTHALMRDQNILALDMESSALLSVARTLGVRAGILCTATVDARSQAKLDTAGMRAAEQTLFTAALDALSTTPAPAPASHPATGA